jgi:hypothetical protein
MKRAATPKPSALRDQRGSVMLETVIALVPVTLGFVWLCQITDLYMHELIVARAASAAARAAVVVLPDDGAHYGDPANLTLHRCVGARKAAIEAAARAVLQASPNFGHELSLRLSGAERADGVITAHVAAQYACGLRVWNPACGNARSRVLRASASLPYQFAAYGYPDRGLM